jgi:hypothetical protein
MSEPNKPLHDWTSHLVSALEYIAVNRRLNHRAQTRAWSKPTKATMLPHLPTGPRWPTQNRLVGD